MVIGELFYGAYHGVTAQQAKNLALVALLQQQFASLPFDDRSAEEYGKVRRTWRAREP